MNYEPYQMKRRRYDLDWLRVLAFGVLILYHSGMFYVAEWGWHIKSESTSETLQFFMLLVNPWRMPLLFFISGAALWFALKRISRIALVKLRTVRLLPPLVLGMLLIVPPQIYYQILQQEGAGFSFFEFYRIYMDLGTDLYPEHQSPLGLMTWTHLWFIPYILVYTLVFVIVKPVLDSLAAWLSSQQINLSLLYVVPASLMILYGLSLRPYFPQTHALVGDWYYHALYFTIFAIGYLMAGQLHITRKLVSARWICLGISISSYFLFVLLVRGVIDPGNHPMSRLIVEGIIHVNAWGWLLTVLAWSAAFLNRPGKVLTYLNTAILPWYILHQTITIILAWNLSKLGMNVFLEAPLVVLGTIAGCALGYEVIRRSTLTRFLFGLKLETRSHPNPVRHHGVLETAQES